MHDSLHIFELTIHFISHVALLEGVHHLSSIYTSRLRFVSRTMVRTFLQYENNPQHLFVFYPPLRLTVCRQTCSINCDCFSILNNLQVSPLLIASSESSTVQTTTYVLIFVVTLAITWVELVPRHNPLSSLASARRSARLLQHNRCRAHS